MTFSKMFYDLRMSPIVTISETAKAEAVRREAEGKPFIFLQRGETDSHTPEYIKLSGIQGIVDNRTKYPKTGGEIFFKDAVLEYLKFQYFIDDLTRNNIVATYGGQEALELAFKLFYGQRGAGFSPIWSCTIENHVPYAQIDFVEVPLNADFKIDYELLDQVTKDCAFFYLNNPHNPTGKVFTEEELRQIIEICTRNQCYIISDEAYEHFVYDDLKHFSLAKIQQDNIITCFTFSKSFSMTGWRVGYAVTRNSQISQLLCYGNYAQTAGVPPFIQYAAAQALVQHEQRQNFIGEQRNRIEIRRNILYTGLQDIPGIVLSSRPQGAFYIFPNFTNIIPDDAPCRKTYIYSKLMENGIACVYGACFGQNFDDYVRLSVSAVGHADLCSALQIMKDVFIVRNEV